MKCEKRKLVYWVASKGMFPEACLDFRCALPSFYVLKNDVQWQGPPGFPVHPSQAHDSYFNSYYLEFLDAFG